MEATDQNRQRAKNPLPAAAIHIWTLPFFFVCSRNGQLCNRPETADTYRFP
jgi:hypothetical protein